MEIQASQNIGHGMSLSKTKQAEQVVLDRANELYEELQGDPSNVTRVKLDFLEVLIARLKSKRTAGL